MGAFINDTTPESVAERLRTVALPPSTSAASLAGTPEGASA
jgi:UDPglucose--hexose-1-phosphate uridylyltransferase